MEFSSNKAICNPLKQIRTQEVIVSILNKDSNDFIEFSFKIEESKPEIVNITKDSSANEESIFKIEFDQEIDCFSPMSTYFKTISKNFEQVSQKEDHLILTSIHAPKQIKIKILSPIFSHRFFSFKNLIIQLGSFLIPVNFSERFTDITSLKNLSVNNEFNQEINDFSLVEVN
jgi:hypothetical protein